MSWHASACSTMLTSEASKNALPWPMAYAIASMRCDGHMRCNNRTLSYLIVDHQVHCAPAVVVCKATEIQGLIHNTLPTECSISVKQDGDVLAPTAKNSTEIYKCTSQFMTCHSKECDTPLTSSRQRYKGISRGDVYRYNSSTER